MWIDALLVASGRKLKFKDIKAAPHGILLGPKQFGHLKEALRTPDKKIQFGSEALLAEARRQLAAPAPAAPTDYPLVLSNRRHRDSMNSWLNELPGLHKHRRDSVVEIHPDDAGPLGVASGDVVRISSPTDSVEVEALVTDATRSGVVVVSHGWGSRAFDPRGGAEPRVFGVNRNSLVGTDIDPLSQTSPLNSSWVRRALHPCTSKTEPWKQLPPQLGPLPGGHRTVAKNVGISSTNSSGCSRGEVPAAQPGRPVGDAVVHFVPVGGRAPQHHNQRHLPQRSLRPQRNPRCQRRNAISRKNPQGHKRLRALRLRLPGNEAFRQTTEVGVVVRQRAGPGQWTLTSSPPWTLTSSPGITRT